ncbi:MAG TPA: acetyltransferase [Planctomycetota bacterium]|nr:acetyltransferase [Planctomycetota bacterium]
MKRALFVALVLLLGTRVQATQEFSPEPILTTTAENWERVELLEDKSSFFAKEPFWKDSRRQLPDIKAGFAGEAEPSSARFLLHCAKGWDRTDDKLPPILLVHGAVVDATKSWGKDGFLGRGGAGLAARLSQVGRRVFAITFAHPHGDNWMQAEQVANAIARIKTLTGAPQVDLLAHSKGGIAARLYCSSLRKPGMTPFRGDVRKLALVGVPNDGIDVAFAYPNLNYWVIMQNANAALCWTEALVYGVWTDLRERSLYDATEGGGAFAGQAQMLKRWDTVYGLYESDEQFDTVTTYNGGKGKVSNSLGIDHAIKEGGDLIAKLNKAGVDKRVAVALLAGSKTAIMGFCGERRGPSDGLLLVRSALATDGITKAGARVFRRDVLKLSHVELVYAEPALRWIEETLGP